MYTSLPSPAGLLGGETMPRKHRTPKQRRSMKRKGHWEEFPMDWLMGEYGLMIGHGNSEERREMWEIYRDSLIEHYRENMPGCCPAAYWQFERGEDHIPHDDQWEVVLDLGEVTKEELDLIRRDWLKMELDLKKDMKRAAYKNHQIGRLPYSGRYSWLCMSGRMDRQSALLGLVEAWRALRETIEEGESLAYSPEPFPE